MNTATITRRGVFSDADIRGFRHRAMLRKMKENSKHVEALEDKTAEAHLRHAFAIVDADDARGIYRSVQRVRRLLGKRITRSIDRSIDDRLLNGGRNG